MPASGRVAVGVIVEVTVDVEVAVVVTVEVTVDVAVGVEVVVVVAVGQTQSVSDVQEGFLHDPLEQISPDLHSLLAAHDCAQSFTIGVVVIVLVGVPVGSPIVKESELHDSGAAAAGSLSGAVGATDSCLSWYNLTAVNIATPAKSKVITKIIIDTALFFIISLTILSDHDVFWRQS